MVSVTARYAAGNDVLSMEEATTLVLEQLRQAISHPGQAQGITLGFAGLDEMTAGAQPGEVVTWVARPNIGKSWSIIKSAVAAHRAGANVLLVSMEMPGVSMARRTIGYMAGMNPDYIKRGTVSHWGQELLHETIDAAVAGAPFHFVSGNLTKSVPTVDALIQEYGPDVVYIDAQYLMQLAKGRGQMKQWELLAAVGTEVQQMALARNRAVHQSVQFNRSQKKGQEGDLANIGGTDVVGQISSIVVAISEGPAGHEETMRKYELIKNREGRKGSIYTNFLFEPIDFNEVPWDEEDDDAPAGQAQAMNMDWMA